MKQMLPQLPDELIREILIIKDQHEQHFKFKQTLKKVPLFAMFKKINRLQNIYDNKQNNNEFETMEDIILQNTTVIEREQMIITLNTCNCCDRHQKKKPSLEQYLTGFIPEYPSSSNNNQQYNCICRCRNISRDICRAQNDEIME
tara:strand:+ start:41 stop:475 length:435 start_codon:yes stop_codon:yes gene_type:complete